MQLKRTLTFLAATAFLATAFTLGGLATSSSATAQTAMQVTAVDTHGNTDEYLARLKDTIAIAKKLAPKSVWRVWVATYAGPQSGMVYVGVEFPDMASLTAADAAFANDAAMGKSIARLAEMGRAITGRSIFMDVTPK